MTKNELRKTAQLALDSEYGFKPAMNDIVLLEADGDGTYIYFEVKGHKYSFRSSKSERLGIWVGKGTIEKEN